MSEGAPRSAVVLFLLAIVAAGGWVMSHTYNTHDPGICGGRYARARTAADSAAVDRFVPDSEMGRTQPRPCGLLRGPTPEEYARADSLLTRAITATGGDSALTHLTALLWSGTTTDGDSSLVRSGSWRIVPPDSGVAITWSPVDSAKTVHRVVVSSASVWAESHGDSVELTPAERGAERELVYDYGLLRLVTLRELGTLLWPLAPDSAGRPGLLVRTATQLDTALYFGPDGRVAALRTTTTAGATTMTLEGTTDVAGVHWFKTMRVARNGRPAFTITITAIRTAGVPTSAGTPGS